MSSSTETTKVLACDVVGPINLDTVLFVDIELDGQERITEIGAVLGDREVIRDPVFDAAPALAELARAARFVAGHNIHAHDLPRLRAALVSDHPLFRLPAIDTLLWSPLAFPKRPYHRLVKDRELVSREGNDPVADARASRELLGEELAWLETRRRQVDPRLPLIRAALIAHHADAPWRGATELLLDGVPELAPRHAARAALDEVSTYACGMALQAVAATIADDPTSWMAAAYVVMWLDTPTGSVVPRWVRKEFPHVSDLIRRLRETDCGRCGFCQEMHSPTAQLQRWFPGLPSFRAEPRHTDGTSLQEAIVRAGIADRSVFATLATGGGKSICFQVPAFARFARRGALTVIVSPLQSLMKDQVESLERSTDTPHAAAVSGALNLVERRKTLERVRDGEIGLLYVSPEQLRNPGVRKALETREIGGWVFDEAHCIAEWGHDFRPDFWYAPRFIKELADLQGVPVPPVSAFTATAQPEVVTQIERRLHDTLGITLLRFDGGTERTNLTYAFERVPVGAREARVVEILDQRLRGHPGAAVIFSPTKKGCEALAADLTKAGWAAAPYHAGLERVPRREVQERFLAGSLQVIVATSAFGMGVDKPDVRLVIHLVMPGSLESYLQQAGRAGRDRLPAVCLLMHDDPDLERVLAGDARSRLRQADIADILRVVRSHAREDKAQLTAGELVRMAEGYTEADPNGQTRAVMALAWLERAAILSRDANSPRVFSGRPRLRTLADARKALAGTGLEANDTEAAIAILQTLGGGGEGHSADDLAELAGLVGDPAGTPYEAGLRVIDLLERMVQAGVLTEGTQLGARLAIGVANASRQRLSALKALEASLLALGREHAPDVEGEVDLVLDVRLLCAGLRDQGTETTPPVVRRLLLAWCDDRGDTGDRAAIDLVHVGGSRFRAAFRADWSVIVDRSRRRHLAAELGLDAILARRPVGSHGKDVAVDFALSDVVDALKAHLPAPFGASEAVPAADRALLWLHDLKVLELVNGLAVFRTVMRIQLNREARQRRFSKDDYAPLARHYQSRVTQIHAMDQYARAGRESPSRARRVASDWFSLKATAFRKRWLPDLDPKLATTTAVVDRLHKPLDDDQRAIMMSEPDTNLVVVAGPGSGKTTTLVHRVAWLVRVHAVAPDGILVLCYNRSTAFDLRKRFEVALGPDARALTVLTLHALAMRLTGRGVSGNGDDKAFSAILTEAAALLTSTEDRPGVAGDELRDRLLGRFSHLFVDEYQDVDAEQAALIDALVRRSSTDELGKRLVVYAVGDDDQNIYAWRKASSDHLRAFQATYTAHRRDLLQNYRSTGAIVAAANALIARLPGRLKTAPGCVDAKRGAEPLGGRLLAGDTHEGAVVRFTARSEACAAEAIRAEITRLRSTYPTLAPPASYAILARHRRALWPLHDFLVASGLPCRVPMPGRHPLHRVREIASVLDRLEGGHDVLHAEALRAMITDVRADAPANPWWTWIDESAATWLAEVGDEPFLGRSVAASLRERIADERGAADFGTGVHLGTQHGAKGLQWDVVFVLGDVSGHDVQDDVDGELRLAYVAVTRARKALYLVDWPRSAAPWKALADDVVTSVAANAAAASWQPLRREVLGLGELWIDYAGRQPSGSRVHRALERLAWNDALAFDDRPDGLALVNGDGVRVAIVSKKVAHGLLARLDRVRSVRVLAVVRRTTDDVDDPDYRNGLRVPEWWLPLVVVDFD